MSWTSAPRRGRAAKPEHAAVGTEVSTGEVTGRRGERPRTLRLGGAFSTSWYVDPREEMVGVLMAQGRPGALRLPPLVLDFWTSAYQAIDD